MIGASRLGSLAGWPSLMLAIVTPGAIHAQFLAEVGDRAGRAPWDIDMARILAVAPKYGIEFLEPEPDGRSSSSSR